MDKVIYMAIVINPVKATPFAEDDFSSIVNDLMVEFDSDYFIFARNVSGGRMYSEDFSIDKIEEYMEKYSSVVKYFGGGEIILCRSFKDDCEIVKKKKIY